MINKIKERIQELYFEKLEEDCVDFLEYEEADQGYVFTRVKDEYQEVTIKEMVDYIWGLDSWQGQWALANAEGV